MIKATPRGSGSTEAEAGIVAKGTDLCTCNFITSQSLPSKNLNSFFCVHPEKQKISLEYY